MRLKDLQAETRSLTLEIPPSVAQYVAGSFCWFEAILEYLKRSEQPPWRVQRDSDCNNSMRFHFDAGRRLPRLLNCLVNQRSLQKRFG
jgi:hypothetical protein